MADPWASPTDVDEIAGVTATDAEVKLAQAVIETVVGRTSDEATARFSARDLSWLKRAVAYQTAWMTAQPDLLTRTETDSQTQDGAHQTYRPDSHVLAPLARRALKKLSWMRSRSLQVGTRGPGRGIDPAAHWVAAVWDEGHEQWIREEV